MNTQDIAVAARESGVDTGSLCSAFRVVLPVLHTLAQRQGFVTRLFIRGFIAALEGYVEERCG